jgi:hypothetical protein
MEITLSVSEWDDGVQLLTAHTINESGIRQIFVKKFDGEPKDFFSETNGWRQVDVED